MVTALSAVLATHAQRVRPSVTSPQPRVRQSEGDQFQLRFGAIVTGEGAQLDKYQVYWDERLEQAHQRDTANYVEAQLRDLWATPTRNIESITIPPATIQQKFDPYWAGYHLEVIVDPADLPAAAARLTQLEHKQVGWYDKQVAMLGPNRNNAMSFEVPLKAPANILRGYERHDPGSRPTTQRSPMLLPVEDETKATYQTPMTPDQIEEALATNQVPLYPVKVVLKDTQYDVHLQTAVDELMQRIQVAKKAYENSYPKNGPVDLRAIKYESQPGVPYIQIYAADQSVSAANQILTTAIPAYGNRTINRTLVAVRRPHVLTRLMAKVTSTPKANWEFKLPRWMMKIERIRNAMDGSYGLGHTVMFSPANVAEFQLPVKVDRLHKGAIAWGA